MAAVDIGGGAPQKPSVNFTHSAARKVLELIQDEGNDDLKLRVYITGGGCSGFQYGFTFDEAVQSDDFVIEGDPNDDGDSGKSGDGTKVKLLIDPMSFQYLQGADIDYVEDVSGEQFVIRNPNAKTTCGCGSSFSI